MQRSAVRIIRSIAPSRPIRSGRVKEGREGRRRFPPHSAFLWADTGGLMGELESPVGCGPGRAPPSHMGGTSAARAGPPGPGPRSVRPRPHTRKQNRVEQNRVESGVHTDMKTLISATAQKNPNPEAGTTESRNQDKKHIFVVHFETYSKTRFVAS